MSEWCQNKKCPDKKTQSQIRGTKGAKYYQSNKASSYYYDIGCSQGCFWDWFKQNETAIKNAVPHIPKQVLPLDDAWFVEYQYNWNSDTQEHNPQYYIRNKNRGVRQPITREQAQSPEDIAREWDYRTIDDTQARELAVQLGLAS
mgnify:CR=1 FL=1